MAGSNWKMDCMDTLEHFIQMWSSEDMVPEFPTINRFGVAEFPQTDYISALRINGRPILPPLMTENRREEMRMYRAQARLRETNRSKEHQSDTTKSKRLNDAILVSDSGQVEEYVCNAFIEGVHKSDQEERCFQQRENGYHGNLFVCSSSTSSPNSKIAHPVPDSVSVPSADQNSTFASNESFKRLDNKDRHSLTLISEDFPHKQLLDKSDSEIAETENICSHGATVCDSLISRDSGVQSASSSHAVSVSVSCNLPIVAKVIDSSNLLADYGLTKSSVDSGMYVKGLVTTNTSEDCDQLETLAEVDNLPLDKSDVSSYNSTSIDGMMLLEGDPEFLPGVHNFFASSEENETTIHANIGSSRSTDVEGDLAEQTISDEFLGSKSSTETTFSDETNRTVISCNENGIQQSISEETNGEMNWNNHGNGDRKVHKNRDDVSEQRQNFRSKKIENCLTFTSESDKGCRIDDNVLEKDEATGMMDSHFNKLCTDCLQNIKLHADIKDETRKEIELERMDGTGQCGEQNEANRAAEGKKEIDKEALEKDTHENEFEKESRQKEEIKVEKEKFENREVQSSEQRTETKPEQEELKDRIQNEDNMQESFKDYAKKDNKLEVRTTKIDQTAEVSDAEQEQEKETGQENKTLCLANNSEVCRNQNLDSINSVGLLLKKDLPAYEKDLDMTAELTSDFTETGADVSGERIEFSGQEAEKKIVEISQVPCRDLENQSLHMGYKTDLSVMAQAGLNEPGLKYHCQLSDSFTSNSASIELPSDLNTSSAVDTLKSSRTLTLVNHSPTDASLTRNDADFNGNAKQTEDVAQKEPVTPQSRVRKNSYVISSADNSHVTVSDCPSRDSKTSQRRNSYTLIHPSEALLAANSTLPDISADLSEHEARDTGGHGKVNCQTRKNPSKQSTGHHSSLAHSENEQGTLPKESVLNSEGDVVLAEVRARAESERIGKLEHLRRFLEQAASAMPSRYEEDESEYLNYGLGYNNIQPLEEHFPNVAPSDDEKSACTVNTKTVLSCADGEVTDPSACDLPVDMTEEELVVWLNEEFERKKCLMEEEHRRCMAQMLAEQQRQQVALQREILRYQQQLQARIGPGTKCRSSKSTQVQSSYSTDTISVHTDDVNKQPAVPRNGPQSMPSCSGSERGILETFYFVASSVQANKPKVGFMLEAGDSNPGQNAMAGRLYYESRRAASPVGSLSTVQSEDNEMEAAYKSPAVLRRRRSVPSSCSPRVPMYASPALRQRTSTVGTPSSGGGSNNSRLATLADENMQVSFCVSKKLERLPALVKGYLTRRLLRTERVQYIIQTIQDTAEFALNFQLESPMKKGFYSMQDRQLHERVIAQLTAAMYEIHEIFFDVSLKERMAVIAQSRALRQEKIFRESRSSAEKERRVSAATLKSIERKRKAVESETVAKQRSNKSSSEDKNAQVPVDKTSSVVTSSRRYRPTGNIKTGHVQTSPRKLGKENVHRILGKEKTRVVAAGTSSEKTRDKGSNVKVVKKLANAQPARKIAGLVDKRHKEDNATERRSGQKSSNPPGMSTRIADRSKEVDVPCPEASFDAVQSIRTLSRVPNSATNHTLGQQVPGALGQQVPGALGQQVPSAHGKQVPSADSSSQQTLSSNNQDNIFKATALHQGCATKCCAVQAKDVPRKVAYVQSRFS